MDRCPDPVASPDVKIKLPHRTCLRFGGEHRLARYLRVRARDVEDWLAGRREIPDEVFLFCVDHAA